MMIDFKQKILGLKGEEIDDIIEMQTNGGTKIVLTLAAAVSQSLCYSYPSEQNISGKEKFRRAKLALEILESSGPLELKSEDVTLVKELLAKLYSPTVVYRAWQMIDPAEK